MSTRLLAFQLHVVYLQIEADNINSSGVENLQTLG